MEDDNASSRRGFSAGAWPLAITVSVGLLVFKEAPGSSWADISYWLVFSPLILLVGAGVAASILLGLAQAWQTRAAIKSAQSLVDAITATSGAIQGHLEGLDDDQLQALTGIVGMEYVRRVSVAALPERAA